MQLRPDQLASHLHKPLAPLYFVHGDEPLLLIEAGDAIRAAARVQGYVDREVLIASGNFKWSELFDAAANMSLFGGNKLIDLRIPNGKPGRDGGEALQRYLDTVVKKGDPGILTLISVSELDWQSKKAAWVTALSKSAVTLECNAPPLPRLPQWIAERLQRQQQSAPPPALDFIAAHVEGNLLAAHQEIQKLGLLYPTGTITLAQIEAAVLNVARYDISDLRNAIKAHDTVRAVRTLEGLKGEDAAAPLVLWALATEARRLAARAALQQAAKIDRMIKGLASGDIWDEFLQLTLSLTRTRTA
ncbi:MAG TPA: DNA polymerase III subunit delta [Rhodocyclaceae bacterium]|nr:DNA polymerase III subunit delta [Rhodocyclaceae bacterium]